MTKKLERRWLGEVMVVVLEDEEGILGMARETTLRLTADRVQLVGKRMGGLNVEIPLGHIKQVKPRLHPMLTLDFESRSGRVEVPAGAHGLDDLMELAWFIQDAVDKYVRMIREQTTGAAGEELEKLRRLIED